MYKNKKLYYLGNLLVFISLIGLIYTVFPLITVYLIPAPPPDKQIINKAHFYLSIPKIHAYSKVIVNVDPWNEFIYNEALKKGVAHAKNSFLPPDNKTIFLFAHSSGAPWQLTHTNTVFLRLGELEYDDKIKIDYEGKEYRYKVSAKKVVSPTQIDFLQQLDKNLLILQTCTPIGTSLNRLLVFAVPES